MEKINYVYILDSGPHLFYWVTGDLEKRVAQPRRKLVSNDNPEWRDLYQDYEQARDL